MFILVYIGKSSMWTNQGALKKIQITEWTTEQDVLNFISVKDCGGILKSKLLHYIYSWTKSESESESESERMKPTSTS